MYLAQSGLYAGLGKNLEPERVTRRIEVDYGLIGQKQKGGFTVLISLVFSETFRSCSADEIPRND